MRVSKKYILLLMPGIKGDEPELVSIVKPGEKQRRKDYKRQISEYLSSKGYQVSHKQGTLTLAFANEQEIRETFYQLAFKNEVPPDKKSEVDAFLDPRTHNFKDGFYIIIGEKE
jgi:hypothetical protein